MCKLFPVCLQKNENKTFLVWLQTAILHGNARLSICHVTVNFTLTLCSACQDLPGQSPTLQYLLQQKSLLVPFCQLIGRKGAVHAGPDHYTVVLLCARHVACIRQWFQTLRCLLSADTSTEVRRWHHPHSPSQRRRWIGLPSALSARSSARVSNSTCSRLSEETPGFEIRSLIWRTGQVQIVFSTAGF